MAVDRNSHPRSKTGDIRHHHVGGGHNVGSPPLGLLMGHLPQEIAGNLLAGRQVNWRCTSLEGLGVMEQKKKKNW